MVAAGLTARVSSADAWAVLDQMLRNEWTYAAIASACDISDRSAYALLGELRAGHRRVIGAKLAGKIWDHGQPTRGHVSAIPSRRKIQALARLGHSGAAVGRTAGLWFTCIAAIRRGDTRRVTPSIAASVDQAWRELCMVTGTDERARTAAEKAGWPPPLAWDDIDDLTEEPHIIGARRGRPSRYRPEEAQALLDGGWTLQEVAMRFNVQADSVARRLKRAQADGAAA